MLVFGANLRIVMSSIMRRRNGLMASSVIGMLKRPFAAFQDGAYE
jgi:hypothetical protein